MKMKTWFLPLVVIATGLLFSSCAQHKTAPFNSLDLNPKLSQGYKQKVENFLVVIDSSTSMSRDAFGNFFGDPSKLNIAKEITDNMNTTIPNIPLTGGLRTFGSQNKRLFGMGKYNQKGFATSLKEIAATGRSPLDKAISAANSDLQPLSGKSALIILSDGKDMNNSPVEAAQVMKNQFGDRLCIYTVHIGNDVQGAEVLSQVANAGKCGFKTNADALSSPNGMADFVEAVFLESSKHDRDGDGVSDDKDQCPNTPRGIAVDAKGCPKDSDGDGVFDSKDKCPDTPAGMQVDNDGCPLPIAKPISINLLVEFDFDKSDIRSNYHNHLKAVAEFLKANPKTRILLEGHTDWEGTPDYNLSLSERRANSVKNYLVKSFGIQSTRLATKGYGETQPVSVNDSKEGRQRNRRVVAKFYNM